MELAEVRKKTGEILTKSWLDAQGAVVIEIREQMRIEQSLEEYLACASSVGQRKECEYRFSPFFSAMLEIYKEQKTV